TRKANPTKPLARLRRRLLQLHRSKDRPLRNPRRPSKNLAARSGRDGCKLRRQRKANILANQIEIALIRKTVFGQALADLFDQSFGCGGAGSKSNTFYPFEPLRIDVRSGVNESGFDAAALGDFDKTIRIGTVLRADDQDEIAILRDLLDGFLAILRCVTN